MSLTVSEGESLRRIANALEKIVKVLEKNKDENAS